MRLSPHIVVFLAQALACGGDSYDSGDDDLLGEGRADSEQEIRTCGIDDLSDRGEFQDSGYEVLGGFIDSPTDVDTYSIRLREVSPLRGMCIQAQLQVPDNTPYEFCVGYRWNMSHMAPFEQCLTVESSDRMTFDVDLDVPEVSQAIIDQVKGLYPYPVQVEAGDFLRLDDSGELTLTVRSSGNRYSECAFYLLAWRAVDVFCGEEPQVDYCTYETGEEPCVLEQPSRDSFYNASNESSMGFASRSHLRDRMLIYGNNTVVSE